MSKFQIFTDSCCDLTPELRKECGVEYVHMNIVVDGDEKPADLDGEYYSLDEFYSWLESGKKIKTNQVTMEEFLNRFRPYLAKGIDILYLACSSALTGSINIFRLAKEILVEEFPGRKLLAVDTLCGAMTEGVCAYTTAMTARKNDFTIEQAAEWCETNKFHCHQFATVDTLSYLRAAGRISGATAFFGNLAGVKPVFISDRKGNNFTVSKVRGTKASLEAICQGIYDNFEPERGFNFIWVGHAHKLERAEEVKKMLEEHYKGQNVVVSIAPIGPIVGTTTGPGCISTFCFGKEVTRFEGDGIAVK